MIIKPVRNVCLYIKRVRYELVGKTESMEGITGVTKMQLLLRMKTLIKSVDLISNRYIHNEFILKYQYIQPM